MEAAPQAPSTWHNSRRPNARTSRHQEIVPGKTVIVFVVGTLFIYTPLPIDILYDQSLYRYSLSRDTATFVSEAKK